MLKVNFINISVCSDLKANRHGLNGTRPILPNSGKLHDCKKIFSRFVITTFFLLSHQLK